MILKKKKKNVIKTVQKLLKSIMFLKVCWGTFTSRTSCYIYALSTSL
jgi:hypothetical protein